MLADRYYMREEPGRNFSAAIILIWTIVGAFLLQQVDLYNGGRFFAYLALSNPGIAHGYVWQLVTYQFLHGGLLHIIFNLIVLYSFGRQVEGMLGSRKFLQAYFMGGVVGGLFQLGLGLVAPGIWGFAPTVGASASIMALVAVFATIEPHTTIGFWGIPVRARHLIVGFALFSIFFILVPTQGGVAHGAHLGGIVAGIAFVKWFMHSDWSMPRFRLKSQPKPAELVATPSGGGWKKAKPAMTEEDLPSGDFISKEVDPILDKISANGIQSLTERERRILEAARAKMAKR
jgi:membrane associated rhomboid family serine protease